MKPSSWIPVVAAVALALPGLGEARMYEWRNPATGSAQLSGEPPAWYRSAEGGPRVRVYENGNLVDDTAIRLPSERREELRQAAFRESEQRERAEALRRLERAALRQQRRKEAQARIAEAEREEQRKRDARAAQAAGEGAGEREGGSDEVEAIARGALDDTAVERLKALGAGLDRADRRRLLARGSSVHRCDGRDSPPRALAVSGHLACRRSRRGACSRAQPWNRLRKVSIIERSRLSMNDCRSSRPVLSGSTCSPTAM